MTKEEIYEIGDNSDDVGIRSLLEKGYLIADTQFINLPKYGVPYDYVVGKMKDIDNPRRNIESWVYR